MFLEGGLKSPSRRDERHPRAYHFHHCKIQRLLFQTLERKENKGHDGSAATAEREIYLYLNNSDDAPMYCENEAFHIPVIRRREDRHNMTSSIFRKGQPDIP